MAHQPPAHPARQVMTELEVKGHKGPIPSPETLREYGELIDNGANRIMAMAEKEQGHRHRMEGLVVMTDAAVQMAGTLSAFIVAVLFILLAFWLFREGKNGPAFVSLLVPLGGLCGVLVWRATKKNEK